MTARDRLERAARRGVLKGIGTCMAPLLVRFERALGAPERAQRRVRARLARALAATDYGRHLGVHGPEDWNARVPVIDYDDYQPWLDRQRETETAVVTPERVLCYEKTSGSSGAAKYIPYTASLRRAFSRMFALWATDLILRGPGLSTGKLYISISPSFSHEHATRHGVPIGLDDDREYLEGWLRALAAPFIVAEQAAARAPTAESFKRLTATLLVGEPRLEVISVWNPSFLGVLLDEIERNREAIAAALGPRMSLDRRRALLVDPLPWHQLWPELKLISCWSSAAARPQARALEQRFPRALVQGKGLLATEAPVTVPLVGRGYAPLVDDILIELETQTGALIPLCAGREGREYGLIVSQPGGLYRYRLGDQVAIGAPIANTPSIELVGRAGGVSDLVGEKLCERFVDTTLSELVPAARVRTLFPVREPADHYTLLVDDAGDDLAGVAAALDAALSRAHHYHHARALGQLGPARVCVAANAAELYAADGQARGMKLGDIKPRALSPHPPGRALGTRFAATTAFRRKEAS